MRNLPLIKLLFVGLIFSISLKTPKAQEPHFKLLARNLQTFPNGDQDSIFEFDINLVWDNSFPSDTFNYAAGEYHLNYNTGIGPVVQISKVGSDLPLSLQSPSVSVNTTAGRISSSPNIPQDNNFIVPITFPGVKVLRLRLRTSLQKWNNASTNFKWRTSGPAPFTKISYFDSTNNPIEINNVNGTFDTLQTNYPLQHPPTPFLYNPVNNSFNNPLSINFIWSKSQWDGAYYILDIFTDSTLTNIFYSNSYILDTIKSVSGFNYQSKYYWRIKVVGPIGLISTSSIWNFKTIPIPNINVNLKVLFEGKYYPMFNLLSKKDSVTLFLRNANSPYNIIDSCKRLIDSVNFSALFTYNGPPTANYYLVAKHYQCIETWSKSGGELLTTDNSIYNYDFTSSASQTYGNNVILRGSKYCMYSGDIVKDGGVNLSDLILIYNDVNNFVSGNTITDLNGDNITDLSDLIIAFNNSSNFVYVISP